MTADEQQDQQQTQPPAPPPAVSDPPADQSPEDKGEPTYSKAEVDEIVARRMRGVQTELERGQAATEELERIKTEQAAQRRKDAEDRGEWKELLQQEQARAEVLEAEAAAAKETAAAYEAQLTEQIKARLDGITDPAKREEARAAIQDLPLVAQQRILGAFMPAQSAPPPLPTDGGGPTR